MAAHSSILAWRIPWTEEPGGLQSMGLQRVRHDWATIMHMLLLSHVQLFAIPWTAAHQASLSFTISQSLLKFMSIESVMPSNHLILCRPLLLLSSIFPRIRVFSNEWALHQSIGTSAPASVLPMNIQGWFPLHLTGWSFLLSRGLTRVFSQHFIWCTLHIN